MDSKSKQPREYRVVSLSECPSSESPFRISRYPYSRFWAVYDGDDLVAVTVYRRGAEEVRRRLQAGVRSGVERTLNKPPNKPEISPELSYFRAIPNSNSTKQSEQSGDKATRNNPPLH